MNMLRRVRIEGYKSIKSMDLSLQSLNILIGANGAGKSNFVTFFKMMNEMMGGRLQEYIGVSGRAQSMLHFGPKITPQILGDLEFETEKGVNRYIMRLFHAAGDSMIFSEERVMLSRADHTEPHDILFGAGHLETAIRSEAGSGNKTAQLICHLLNQSRVYHFHDTSALARIRLFCYINDNRYLMPDAGNLAAMLFAYQETSPTAYRRIVSTVGKIVPEFKDFELAPSRLNPNEIVLNWRKHGHDYLFGPHQISDGSLRAMAICTLLLQPGNDLPNLIVLDEPELGLHPHALEIVAGLIRAASLKSQIIVSTQSQSFLNYFGPSEIVTVETRGGKSLFRRLTEEDLSIWLSDYSIGELWQRNVIGGGPTL